MQIIGSQMSINMDTDDQEPSMTCTKKVRIASHMIQATQTKMKLGFHTLDLDECNTTPLGLDSQAKP